MAFRFIETCALTRENYRAPAGIRGSAAAIFLLNVSVDVSSVALIELCQEKGRGLYLDTPASNRGRAAIPIRACRLRRASNYALRESALALRPRYPRWADRRSSPTAPTRVSSRILSNRR